MPSKKIDLTTLPENCDFRCPHADFPPAESAGICRTMSAVKCRLLDELVNKNTPCAWRARAVASAKRPRKKAQPRRTRT